MKVSVIIPSYNRVPSLTRTLDSFLRQSYDHSSYEIIVADNNSTDSTEELVKKYQQDYPKRMRYLQEPRQGVHYARNSAAKIATGAILYFTDDDMIADKNLLRELIRVFEFDSHIACATGRVLPKWEVEPPDWIMTLCYNHLLSLHDPPEEFIISTQDCEVYSCHQAILRDVFFESGGFNPENTAGEWVGDGETGLNLKIRELGYKFGYTGKSLIYHIIPPERMTQPYLNRRFGNQGNADSYTYYRQYHPSHRELWQHILKNFFELLWSEIKFLIYRMCGKIWWRTNLANVFYYWQRIRYDYKLIIDESWRQTVLRDDWLMESELEKTYEKIFKE